ncbi:unnamed protein product [Discosporangium mesarthrocarpum]
MPCSFCLFPPPSVRQFSFKGGYCRCGSEPLLEQVQSDNIDVGEETDRTELDINLCPPIDLTLAVPVPPSPPTAKGHANNLKALLQHLDALPNDVVVGLALPRATPIVYQLDENLRPLPSEEGGSNAWPLQGEFLQGCGWPGPGGKGAEINAF